jgi:hypothetical protein
MVVAGIEDGVSAATSCALAGMDAARRDAGTSCAAPAMESAGRDAALNAGCAAAGCAVSCATAKWRAIDTMATPSAAKIVKLTSGFIPFPVISHPS